MRLPRVLNLELTEQILAIDKRIVLQRCNVETPSVRRLRKEIARLLTKRNCDGCDSIGVDA